MWKVKISSSLFILTFAALGINYIGKTLAQTLSLPLWLDSIGTMLAALVAGALAGAFVGVVNNLIYGLVQNPVILYYMVTQLSIAVMIGIFSRRGYIKSYKRAAFVGLLAGIVATIASTPVNVYIFGGSTDNHWANQLLLALKAQGMPVYFATMLGELPIDVIDKVTGMLIVFSFYKTFPKSLIKRFESF